MSMWMGEQNEFNEQNEFKRMNQKMYSFYK